MTQHRVYFTETFHGYILCDSKDHAEAVQECLDNGESLDEIDAYVQHVDGEREHSYKPVD